MRVVSVLVTLFDGVYQCRSLKNSDINMAAVLMKVTVVIVLQTILAGSPRDKV